MRHQSIPPNIGANVPSGLPVGVGRQTMVLPGEHRGRFLNAVMLEARSEIDKADCLVRLAELWARKVRC